jgi:hypothetical protein
VKHVEKWGASQEKKKMLQLASLWHHRGHAHQHALFTAESMLLLLLLP